MPSLLRDLLQDIGEDRVFVDDILVQSGFVPQAGKICRDGDAGHGVQAFHDVKFIALGRDVDAVRIAVPAGGQVEEGKLKFDNEHYLKTWTDEKGSVHKSGA